jgi:hypothetical protein
MKSFNDEHEAEPVLTSEEALIEQEMKALAEKVQGQIKATDNNLIAIQNADTKIEEFENLHQKFFLKWLYQNAKKKKHFAYASLAKGILNQNKMFFCTSKDLIKKLVASDPDNTNKAASVEWKKFNALLAGQEICQLWDGTNAGAAGYAVLPTSSLSTLLKVDNELALKQFKELKAFCKNDWVTEDMIFEQCGEKCGELRLKIPEHRALIEQRRANSSEPTTENNESSGIEPSNTVDEEDNETTDSSLNVTAAIQNEELYTQLLSSVKGLVHALSVEAEIKRNFKDFHSSYLELDKDSFISYLKKQFKQSLLKHANNIYFSDGNFKTSISGYLKKFGYSETDTDKISSYFIEAIKTV